MTPPETCQTPNTSFPSKASNEDIILHWQEPDDYTSQCTENSGIVQTRLQDCKTEYRCVKEVEEDKDDCRKQSVASYISPTSGIFHEDIALVGTELNLHYQSAYLENDTIASGWSFNLHHKLSDDYLHLGTGEYINISSTSSIENGITTVVQGSYNYVFNELGLHVETKDTLSKKTLYTFEYNSNNKLISINDAFNNATTIQRDRESKVLSITSPHSHVNTISIDTNNDLVQLSYEDNSAYTFTYEEHLMLSETEPNGNEFLHVFDENGRVVKIVDALNAEFLFSSTSFSNYNETKVSKPNSDITIYKDYMLENDVLLSETITPSNDTISTSSSADGLNTTTNRCGVTSSVNYKADKDPITLEKLPSTTLVSMPSGLSKTTHFSKEYKLNTDNTLLSASSTTTTNGATTTTLRDYNTSTLTITSPESRITTIKYNKRTLLPTKLQANNLKALRYKYDAQGRVILVKQGKRQVQYIYDEKSNVKKEINLQTNTTTSYTYDQRDRLTSTTYPTGSKVEFSYDKNNNRTKLVTPSPSNHTFEYNGVNKQISNTSPLGYKTLYTYDKQRRVTNITRASGKSINNIYDKGRVVSKSTDDSTTNYGYTCGDKLTSLTSGSESVNYQYDGDLIKSITQSGVLNETISYTYNNDFLPVSFSYADLTDNYTYDKDGYITSTSNFSITKDPINAQTTNISDGVLNQEYSYNNYGEVKSIKSDNHKLIIKRENAKISQVKDISIDFIQKKNRVKKLRHKNIYNYTYDNRGRLISVSKNNQEIENYTYDANGNRISATVNGVTTTASYTLDDNLEVYGNNTYMYDADGYLVEKTTPSQTTNYTYNTLGALTSVTTPTKTVTYHLNALNQRVAKEVDGEITEKYLWRDLTTLLAVYDKDDNLIQRFNYTDQRMPISMTQENQTYYLHYNQVGTLRVVTNQENQIVKEITYDTFGTILSDTNTNLNIPFGFAGGLHDRDTNLVHFGYREYDTYTGKWTAKDPIGFDGGDTNLYGYVLGDPVNLVDPTGEISLIELGSWGITAYVLFEFADKWLGNDAKECDRSNIPELLDDARETGKNIFPVGITHPALGIGTKAGENINDASNLSMEILK